MSGEARERWNARYAARSTDGGPSSGTASHPAPALTSRAHLLPATGRALDLAGGAGRHAVWLARRGLTTTLVDVSDAACAQAEQNAAQAGVPLEVLRADVEVASLPAGPWDVIVVHHWLDRDVWRALPGLLAPGGTSLWCQPTVTNLERHPRPSRRWLLEDGELAVLVAEVVGDDADLEVVELTEGWTDEGRHEALAVLRRRADRGPDPTDGAERT